MDKATQRSRDAMLQKCTRIAVECGLWSLEGIYPRRVDTSAELLTQSHHQSSLRSGSLMLIVLARYRLGAPPFLVASPGEVRRPRQACFSLNHLQPTFMSSTTLLSPTEPAGPNSHMDEGRYAPSIPSEYNNYYS